MNRRLTLAALVACVPLMSSCAVVDFFGPRPNAALVELAQTAQADAQASQDEEFSQMRLTQSEALFQEINRVCGLEEDGMVPDTCTINDEEHAGPSGSAKDAVAQLVELADDAPADSRPLLISQAISLADGNAELPAEPDEKMVAEAKQLLENEYATIYGLDVAEANGAQVNTDVHEALSLELKEVIGAEAPVSGASYEASWPDDSNAQQFADELVQASRNSFEALAATTDDPQWRNWLIHAAAKI